ncbi:substrate-binding periplasmic protein [Thalassolituus sp.]|uniref:substrate-binding periplasmic protein n=1 Tax=Thalassolituus sp. TaxID=2030822 RepID=UPI003512DE2F
MLFRLSYPKQMLAALVLASGLCAPAQAEHIRLGADVWYPFNGEPDSPRPGYMIELASAVWKQAGHTVDYQVLPWERAIDEARAGSLDCIVGTTLDEAPDFLFPDQPLGMDESYIFVLKDNDWQYTGIGSLSEIRIGVVGGYSYDDGEFDEYVTSQTGAPTVQVMKGNNALDQNLQKLLSRRIDALVESPMVMHARLQQLSPRPEVRVAGRIGSVTPLYIACSPSNPMAATYVRQLNDGIVRMRMSGELANLLDLYNLRDWQMSQPLFSE